MPKFMDIHTKMEGVTADQVAAAHQKDLQVQGRYGVEYLKYWVDEGAGTVFCLSDGPSKEAVVAVHREAHGLIPDEVFEVREGS